MKSSRFVERRRMFLQREFFRQIAQPQMADANSTRYFQAGQEIAADVVKASPTSHCGDENNALFTATAVVTATA